MSLGDTPAQRAIVTMVDCHGICIRGMFFFVREYVFVSSKKKKTLRSSYGKFVTRRPQLPLKSCEMICNSMRSLGYNIYLVRNPLTTAKYFQLNMKSGQKIGNFTHLFCICISSYSFFYYSFSSFFNSREVGGIIAKCELSQQL